MLIMKRVCLTTLLLVAVIAAFGQVTEAEKQLKVQKVDTLLGWKKGGVININSAQTSLTNWAAGGQSSIAIGGLLSLYAHNKKDKSLWENYLDLGYGTLKQKEQDWWKTDDRIDFTSKFGLKATDKLYYAALMNFKTQFTDGYNYPNDSDKISGFLAPGYLLGALGLDYKPSDNFTLFLAPITYKLTIVNDDVLSEAGAFGVDPGENTKSELGGYLRAFMKKDVMENITFQTKLDLFSNYLKDFGNIDVSWESLLSMKVNKLISATLSTHLLYDHDIAIAKEEDGVMKSYKSKVQFKEVLAIGFSMNF
jgi:hypothetical protein